MNKEKYMTDVVKTDAKDFQPVDTTVVQVRSVLNFMYALGYALDRDSKTGRFVTEIAQWQGNRYLGFSTAAKLHNLADENWVSLDGESFQASSFTHVTGFSPLGLRLAQASKLVKQVKLRVTKHGQVITLDPMVIPLNKVVESLIGL
jgi:hypothetical protein